MIDTSLPVPFDRILEEARLKFAIAREHLSNLSSFGINQQWLDDFQKNIEAAVAIPTYETQLAELKELTAIKDAKLAECLEWGQKLRLRIELATKDKKLKRTEFPSKAWLQSQRNESRLITFFPTLINLAKTNAEVLATVGQTPEEIQAGEKMLQELITANQNQEEYKLKRINVTADRQSAYRILYDSVNRINQIGQMVYNDNEANKLLFRSNWGLGNGENTAEESIESAESLESLESAESIEEEIS
jgi:hypothetical protein